MSTITTYLLTYSKLYANVNSEISKHTHIMETTPTPTPEQHLEQNARLAFTEAEVINKLRAGQREAYNKILAENPKGDDAAVSALVDTEMNRRIGDYLDHIGIPEDAPQYPSYADALRGFSYDKISDSVWRYGEWEDDEHTKLGPKGPDLLHAKRIEFFGDPSTEAPKTPESTDDEAEKAKAAEIKAEQEKLGKLREELASATAKRQGKVISFSSDHSIAREKYNEQLRKVGTLELADSLNDDDKTDSEKEEEVVGYLFKEQKELRDLTKEKLAGTKASKFIDWLNRGNTATRIAKGAGLAVAAGGIAFAGGFIVGGGTAAASIIAVTVAGTNRFARGFARSDHKRGRGMRDLEDQDKQDATETIDSSKPVEERFDAAHHYFTEQYDKDTKAEQRKRLKSVGAGVLLVAFGSTLGAAAHALSESSTMVNVGEHVKKFFAVKEVHADAPSGSVDKSGYPSKHVEPGDGGKGHIEKPVPNGVDVNKDLSHDQLFDGSRGSTEFSEAGQKDFNKWIEGHKIKSGETVWGLSKQYLIQEGNPNPNVYEIDAVKDSVLKEFQAKGITDHRGWLSKGAIIKLK